MSNIIDSIQLSGTVYTLSAQTEGGGVPESTFTAYTATTDERISQDEEVTAAGLNALNEKITPTVELTQAEYDALVTKDPNTFYVITDAQAGDLTNYYTKSETNTLLNGKQATLVSGTNIKTINNESILGSGNIDIQGGGKAIEAGRGIAITTGETADTVSFNLPISANTNNSVVMGGKINSSFTNNGRDCLMVGSYLTTKNGSDGSLVVGYNCSVNGDGSAVIGWNSSSTGDSAFAFGAAVTAKTHYTFAAGRFSIANNMYETSFGQYNASNTGSTNADKTLFSVGNGTANNARHNAFEIRQNGDIYLTKDGQDVKLQDQLGGSSITVDTALDSGSTNPVENRVIYNKIDEVEQVTAAALNELNDAIQEKQDQLSAGTNITISGNVISATGGGGGTVESAITSGSTNAVESKAIWSATTYNKEVQLQYDYIGVSTNYPSGCKKFVVTVPQWSNTFIYLYNGGNQVGLGNIQVQNNGSPSVSIRDYTGITYTIDGTDVTFVIPDSITFDAIQNNSYTIVAVKAIVEGAWVNENTYMKSEVDTIKNNLQNNINAKLDATAYTPTVCDTVLNDVSTNPVQNQALFDELRLYDTGGTSEITLTFNGNNSTNYPTSSRQMIVELGGNASGAITFNDNGGSYVGRYDMLYMPEFGMVNINNSLNGSTYELSGSTLTISYPSVSTITSIEKNDTSGIFTSIKSVISGKYTPLIDQVSANTVSIQGKQDQLIAGSGITISGNVISATGGGGEVSTAITSGDTNAVAGGAVYDKFDEVEQVTAAGLNALNDKFDGLKLKKLTQTEYNNLQTKDNNTLYVIVN